MDSDSEIEYDYYPRFRAYKNGRIERLVTETFVPPSLTPQNGVVSKDAVYSPEKNLSLRLYLPHKASEENKKKLPLLVYFHGGGFIMGTAFSQLYHAFLTSTVSAAECVAVSVDYRLAPEHPVPAAYEDSWDAVEWIFRHVSGAGPETWLNENADFGRVFIAGDSAGANIAHHMGMRAGKERGGEFRILGMTLFHPFFLSKVGGVGYFEGIWDIASPDSDKEVVDQWINVVGSDLSGLGSVAYLAYAQDRPWVAGKDVLAREGWVYEEELKKSGWGGKVEVMETEGEGHVFHLRIPDSDRAREVVQRFAEFIKDQTEGS